MNLAILGNSLMFKVFQDYLREKNTLAVEGTPSTIVLPVLSVGIYYGRQQSKFFPFKVDPFSKEHCDWGYRVGVGSREDSSSVLC